MLKRNRSFEKRRGIEFKQVLSILTMVHRDKINQNAGSQILKFLIKNFEIDQIIKKVKTHAFQCAKMQKIVKQYFSI